MFPRGPFACIPLFLLLISGCTSTRQTNTARTASEQLLISNAVDQALAKVDFSAFQGQQVLVEEKYLDCSDKGYIVGSIRHRLMDKGALIATKPEEADVVMEVRSGGVGTDDADSYMGVPQIVLPGLLTIPEVKMVTRNRQTALAKLGIVAYDAKSHHVLGAGGVSSSLSDTSNLYVFGFGPLQSGTALKELKSTTHRDSWELKEPYNGMGLETNKVVFNYNRIPNSPGKIQMTGAKEE